ncbi:hypothetical protein LG047_19285 [Methylocystis sp. WRRC1]|uniref:hypothetical protein n=1 Tax=Methylocystis sp. WRRC1 TaxID=1732014 RepID=UPI001D158085|nr:hypothetical protein [Methylocystis sp. WRRC1]MCC3247436.1 hypothetical protein [Methylocystis sp. WRRC1]
MMQEEEAVADAIRERAEERAAAALDRADAALSAARPFAGAADHWGREGDGATVPQSPAPSRAAPAPSPAPATLADEDAAPVRMGVLVAVLRDAILRERVHAAQIIAGLERRIEALETKTKRGKNGNR